MTGPKKCLYMDAHDTIYLHRNSCAEHVMHIVFYLEDSYICLGIILFLFSGVNTAKEGLINHNSCRGNNTLV